MSSWTDEITDRTLHEECVAIVSECVHEVLAGDSSEFSDRLHETVDSHRWVIYTGASQALLAVSHFDAYAIGEFGEGIAVKDGAINWSGLAYGALYGQCCETDPDDAAMDALRATITTEDRNADLEGDETFADLLCILEHVR